MARAQAQVQDNRIFNEALGIVLLGIGTLLFLALVSYTPRDLPGWFFLAQTTGNNASAHNFIGPAGAMGAACIYFIIGAGAYLVAAALLGYGWASLLATDLRLGRRWPWLVVFIISGACLLQIQPWFLADWPKRMNIRWDGPAAGGWLGYIIGERILLNSLGLIGSAILLCGVYLTSLIMMTGLQPVRTLRRILTMPGSIWRWWQTRQMEKRTELERLELEQQRLEREQLKAEKQLQKRSKSLPAQSKPVEEPEEELDEEILNRPAPQIIDTAVVTAKPPLKKTEKEKLEALASVHIDNYQLPDVDLLDQLDTTNREAADPEELLGIQNTLIETLAQFGVIAAPGDITKGPTITRYELYPAKGVRVDRIVSLERDLARATRAERINILAPIPGKDTVGVEIANSRKVKVTLRELFESEEWTTSKARIPLALGKDVYGKSIIADLAVMPHCLVAGTTGSGKSVCINAIIASMLYRFTPEELRLVMIDPKVVEMQHYNKLPHLVVPVVTDPKKVLLALRWVISEMEQRYKIFAKVGVRNISTFNARPQPKSQAELDAERDEANAIKAAAAAALSAEPESINFSDKDDSDLFLNEDDEYTPPPVTVPRDEELVIPHRMPYIVIIVDELADLMQTAPADVESAIARITQMARAAGIHMIVATQTPRADVVTGIIKANIPSRIAFQVSSKIDSRVILDENGAERLLGQGDMLYLPPGTSRMVRAQGVLVTDEEIHRIVDFSATQGEPSFNNEIHEKLNSGIPTDDEVSPEDEELVTKCLEVMRQEKRCSTSMLQRRLRLGYTRAARIVDILESRGVIGPENGAKPREILVDLDAAPI